MFNGVLSWSLLFFFSMVFSFILRQRQVDCCLKVDVSLQYGILPLSYNR